MYTYRELETGDLPVICSFPENPEELYYMFPKADYPLTPSQIEESLKERFRPIVVLDNKAVVAYANFFKRTETECWMGNVIVAPAYRGKGAAQYLIQAMADIARREFGAEKLRLVCHNTNTRGLLFYAKQGFKPFAFSPRQKPSGQAYMAIQLEKQLEEQTTEKREPMLGELVRRNRSYRRFVETTAISRETLAALLDYARLSPSGANKQALRYFLSCDPATNARVFPALGWAGYLTDWPGPEAGERPAAYIVIVQELCYKMSSAVDYGIAAQTILLGAVEMGLGGCMIGNLKKEQLREALQIPENYEILLAVALGEPKESVVLDDVSADGNIRYWRDAQQVHHVPKFKLEQLILN